MTDLQYASLVISLSTLGQMRTIEDVDAEQLRNLDHLLDAARENVRRVQRVLLAQQDKESSE